MQRRGPKDHEQRPQLNTCMKHPKVAPTETTIKDHNQSMKHEWAQRMTSVACVQDNHAATDHADQIGNALCTTTHGSGQTVPDSIRTPTPSPSGRALAGSLARGSARLATFHSASLSDLCVGARRIVRPWRGRLLMADGRHCVVRCGVTSLGSGTHCKVCAQCGEEAPIGRQAVGRSHVRCLQICNFEVSKGGSIDNVFLHALLYVLIRLNSAVAFSAHAFG